MQKKVFYGSHYNREKTTCEDKFNMVIHHCNHTLYIVYVDQWTTDMSKHSFTSEIEKISIKMLDILLSLYYLYHFYREKGFNYGFSVIIPKTKTNAFNV